MPIYFVYCSRVRPLGLCITVSESHRSLASALDAFLDHQQRPWHSVSLTPKWPRAYQLSLFASD